MPAPVNDDLLNATAIPAGASLNGTTEGGSVEADEVNYFQPTSSVWYSYTPTESGAVAFSVASSAITPVLIVQSAAATTPPTHAALQDVTNNYDGAGFAPGVQFYAEAGKTYYLQVAGAPGTEGAFDVASIEPDPAIDVTPPPAPVIDTVTDLQGTPVESMAAADTLVFSGTAEPLSTVIIKGNPGGVDTELGSIAADAEGNWSITVENLAAGDYSFGAISRDAASNQSLTASALVAITLEPAADTTPPDAPVILAIANGEGAIEGNVSDLPVLILSGTAEANSTITVFNGNETVGAPVTTDADGNWTFTTPALPEGSYSFTATATDTAGNISTTTPTPAVVEIDLPAGTLEAPAALALDPASDSGTVGNGMTTDATPTITGTAADGLTITLYNGETVLGSAVAEGGTWAITPEQALAAGTYQLTAIASDAEGNTSDLSDPLALTINAFRDPAGFPSEAPAFDAQYYLAMNPDVAAAGADPLAHYQASGWQEGRDPNALFNVEYYLNQNQDVAAAGIDPLAHYTEFGWQEGREPSYAFSGDLYLQNNVDVAEAGLNPLVHYLYFGMAEERVAFQSTPEATGPQNPLVDAQFYFETNPDVAASGIDPSRHFAEFGWEEGRDPNAFFDVDYYLATYADVAEAGIDPLQHFLEFGAAEGRNPSAAFSTSGYLAANADVAADGINPLQHYLQYGIAENRQPVPVTVLEPVPDLV